MKIIIIGPAHPYRGGISDTNESFALALKHEGHRVSIITFTVQYPTFLFPGKSQFSEDKAPDNLKINRLINALNPFNWIKSAHRINEEKADLIIFRYWTPFLAPALGFICRRIKHSIKIALCDNVIPHEKKFFDHAFTTYFLPPFDGFITLSKQVEHELKQFSSAPVIVHPHPINLNLGEAIPKNTAKEKLGLKKDVNYLLFFGLIRKYKGLDLMLRAMAEKEVNTLNAKLLVVGEFYDDPASYEKMIDDLGISDLVEIRNQFIPTEEIKAYFSACDLVTQTYHTASQSGITQMAINFNKPVLVTDVGGLSEIIHHMKSGYVVEKDPKLIAAQLVDFYKNDREEAFSSYTALEKTKYSWSNLAKKTADFANQLTLKN